jgi:hypothetical protein
MPMVNDPNVPEGWAQGTAANPPQQTVAGAVTAWDTVRWFFNVVAASQHDVYTSAIDAYGGIG